tara:strand:- start:2681 stop:3637 length:957 start_codon:yes stop_codon:yes gene_type:complete
MIEKNSKIFVAGHRGLVGSSILTLLKNNGFKKIITRSRKQLDLVNQQKVNIFFKKNKIEYLIICAAKVGGIMSNLTYPTEFIFENSMIQLNLLKAALDNKIKKTIFLGTSCIYPKFSKTPIKEEYLLSGNLEKTNEAYAIAKISGIKLSEAMYNQFGFKVICLMPTNLYGGKDNFDEFNSHVIPGIFTKIFKAKKNKRKKVILWGSGRPRREFLFVDDLANAIFYLLKLSDKKLLNINKNFPIFNIGSGEEISIKDLAYKIKKICKFEGKIFFDKSFPDGTLRKNLDSSRIKKTGWRPKIKLNQGLVKVLENYKKKNF